MKPCGICRNWVLAPYHCGICGAYRIILDGNVLYFNARGIPMARARMSQLASDPLTHTLDEPIIRAQSLIASDTPVSHKPVPPNANRPFWRKMRKLGIPDADIRKMLAATKKK